MRKVSELLHRHPTPTTGTTGFAGNQFGGSPYANYLPPNVLNWQQGQPIPQGWRLGRKGYLKPIYQPTGSLLNWQQGQPIPQGYRLSKRGTLRPVDYYQWWYTTYSASTSATTNVLPAQVELREKPAVVQEVIKPGVREEIQPVIHRDREQLEIREELQPIYEKSVRPTIVENRQLPAEMRPEVRMGQMPILQQGPQGGVVVEAEHRETFMHAPMVEETVHKKIIEEVQPVIHREVIAPRVIHETKPIYEKIVEAPVVSYTTLPPRYMSESMATTTTTTTTTTFIHPYGQMLPQNIANWQQGQPIPQGWRLGRKGYLKPIYQPTGSLANWQQGQPIPEGYRLNKRGTLRPVNYFDWWNTMNAPKMQQAGGAGFVPTPVRQF